ncbi:hypothetical protein [Burkholderia ubonensis]|uniref:hypothetical protein n=1 Tax=Burkholderia ubonensis TaxID=101571 RepID=UPI000A5F3939|nr:hypothetical protein [Burkholderia ubonensis]
MNTINTAYLVVKIGQLSNELDEASAKGFCDNAKALNIVSELKDAVELLEEMGHREFAQ